jgi:replicative DNA helicase
VNPWTAEEDAAFRAAAGRSQNGAGRGQEPRVVDGAAFILDAPTTVPAVLGDDSDILWACGEPLLVVGPTGVGKTTLSGQLTRGRLGLDTQFLGLPVAAGRERVLYIAADRPRQAQRALRRIFTEADRETLRERLIVWRGPLPFDIGREPDKLAPFTASHDADTLVIDSLTNVALDLSKDETGARVNHALQATIATGIEVVANHHQRKASANNPKPRTLSDVYGSAWLTAGAGSVLLLWGEPGDPILDLQQLKAVLGEGANMRVLVDHDSGTIERQADLDPAAILAKAGQSGLTANDAARLLYEAENPTRAQVEKARRQLERLRRAGLADRREDEFGAVSYVHTGVTDHVTGVTP